jgi:hypothetical protein
MTNIKDETVQRMVELVGRLARLRESYGKYPGGWFACDTELGDEALAIVAELPKPVDPDREATCKIIQAWYGMDDFEPESPSEREDLDRALAAFKRVKGGGA